MEERFGLLAMRDSYIAEAKLRRRKSDENYRDLGQAVEKFFRRAYPENLDVVRENALTTVLENCSDSADFRMAVKRTRPQTLQDAVKNVIQEECIRLGESEKQSTSKPTRPVFDLQEGLKSSYERGRYQRSRKTWVQREQAYARSKSERNGSCHNDDSSRQTTNAWNNSKEQKEIPEKNKDHLN